MGHEARDNEVWTAFVVLVYMDAAEAAGLSWFFEGWEYGGAPKLRAERRAT